MQLLLPLATPDGRRFDEGLYRQVARELTERFGGLTAHARAPAAGLWQQPEGGTQRDDIVVYEVMVERLEPEWWAAYRQDLERRFEQEELVVRAQQIERL